MGGKINYEAWGSAPWVFWQWDCRQSRREPKTPARDSLRTRCYFICEKKESS